MVLLIGKSNYAMFAGVVVFGLLAGPVVRAAENGNFDGLESISAHCEISTKRKVARRLCDRLTAAAESYAQNSDISYRYAGINPPQPGQDEGSGTKEMQLVFFVRGTNGKSPGISVRVRAGVIYKAAIESGISGATPRRGVLVLWEKAVVSQGPVRKMLGAVGPYVAKQMQELFDLVAARKRGE